VQLPVIIVLLVFWSFMAYRAFQRGDIAMAAVFAAVGIVLTIYRFGLRKKAQGSAAAQPPSGSSTPN
jgi:hypothetical protein